MVVEEEHPQRRGNGRERKIKYGVRNPGKCNVTETEGRECFQKEGMSSATLNGLYSQQKEARISPCILCSVYFNKLHIKICILSCNKIILHGACAKLFVIVTTVLNYIYSLNKGG